MFCLILISLCFPFPAPLYYTLFLFSCFSPASVHLRMEKEWQRQIKADAMGSDRSDGRTDYLLPRCGNPPFRCAEPAANFPSVRARPVHSVHHPDGQRCAVLPQPHGKCAHDLQQQIQLLATGPWGVHTSFCLPEHAFGSLTARCNRTQSGLAA